MKTTSARLALLFREAGLINETQWKTYVAKKRPGEGKQLGAILKSDALSLQTYRDLLTKFPFGRKQDQEIEKVLSEAVNIPARDIIHILKGCSHANFLKNILWIFRFEAIFFNSFKDMTQLLATGITMEQVDFINNNGPHAGKAFRPDKLQRVKGFRGCKD